jgi:hypothetical protein
MNLEKPKNTVFGKFLILPELKASFLKYNAI